MINPLNNLGYQDFIAKLILRNSNIVACCMLLYVATCKRPNGRLLFITNENWNFPNWGSEHMLSTELCSAGELTERFSFDATNHVVTSCS